MTQATEQRIARLYKKTVGYDPLKDGWTAPEALAVLQEYRANGWAEFEVAA